MSEATVPAPPGEEKEHVRVLGRLIPRPDHGFIDFLLNRTTGIIALIGVILGAAILPSSGYGVETCTMVRTLGLPCPGCGLTRSVTSIYHGHWLAAWQYNPFGFIFALMFVLVAPVAFLPRRVADRIRSTLRPHSYPIGMALIVFTVGLMLHGGVRAVMIAQKSPAYAWWWDGTKIPPAFQHLKDEGE